MANLRTNLLGLPWDQYFAAVRRVVQLLEVELNILGPKTVSQDINLEDMDKCARIMFSASLLQQINKVLHHRAEQVDSLTLDGSIRRETNTLLVFCEHAFEHVSIKAAVRFLQSLVSSNDANSKKNILNITQMSGNAFSIALEDGSIQLKAGTGACGASRDLADQLKLLCQHSAQASDESKSNGPESRNGRAVRQSPPVSNLSDSIPETPSFMPNQLFSPMSESTLKVASRLPKVTAAAAKSPPPLPPSRLSPTPADSRPYNTRNKSVGDEVIKPVVAAAGAKEERPKPKGRPPKIPPAAPTVASRPAQSQPKRNGHGGDDTDDDEASDFDPLASESAARTRPAKRSRDDSIEKETKVKPIDFPASSEEEESDDDNRLIPHQVELLMATADPRRVSDFRKAITKKPATIKSILEGPGEASDIRERLAVLAAIQSFCDDNPDFALPQTVTRDVGRLCNQVLFSHQKAKKQKT
jgi:hypothetical protein